MTKGIIGAVIGDIAGSVHEFSSVSSMRFGLFTSSSSFTDDTALTMAVAEWMLNRDKVSIDESLLKWGRTYPNAGYGQGFKAFLKTGKRNPEGSTHNGSAMRVSPVGFMADTLEQALELAKESALPSHDTPGAIAGAQAIAVAIWMAKNGSSKEDIKTYLEKTFGYRLSRRYNEVRDDVQMRLAMRSTDKAKAHELLLAAETTVQDALTAFLASDSYEETIKRAIYMGGDSDTLACMAGGVAAAFWGVPDDIIKKALVYLPDDMISIINSIDGTSWKPTGITPPSTKRWREDDVVVYGTNDDDTNGEQGFFDVRISRFHHHPNTGYPVYTIGHSIDDIAAQVDRLRTDVESHPERRYLVREIGISKAGYTPQQISPMFSWAIGNDRVLLPESFVRILSR